MAAPVREVEVAELREAIRRLCLDASFVAPADLRAALALAGRREESPLGRQVIALIADNMATADARRVPICQDTGTVVVFLAVGQDVHFTGGALGAAVDDGVRAAWREGWLRPSIVASPIGTRVNSGDNTPAVLHVELVEGDRVEIVLLAKGGGAENMSRLTMLTPSDGAEGVRRFVRETVELAGPNACPPVIAGVGIGGTFDTVGTLAKHALTRTIGNASPDPALAALEATLLADVNALGIGPHGFGGRVTALAVHVETAPTHIASLPVAVNLQCGPAARVVRATL